MQGSSPAKVRLVRARALTRAAVLLLAIPCMPATARSSIGHSHKRNAPAAARRRLVVREIDVVDKTGRVRMTLSAGHGSPSTSMFGLDGTKRTTISIDESGYGSVQITNPTE